MSTTATAVETKRYLAIRHFKPGGSLRMAGMTIIAADSDNKPRNPEKYTITVKGDIEAATERINADHAKYREHAGHCLGEMLWPEIDRTELYEITQVATIS